jgi:hypothetical protein
MGNNKFFFVGSGLHGLLERGGYFFSPLLKAKFDQ